MSNPKVRIEGDVSGINRSLDELRAKGKQVTDSLSGKVSLNTGDATKNLADLTGLVGKFHQKLSDAAGSGIGTHSLDGLTQGFDDAVKSAQELAQVVSQIGGTGSSNFNKTTDSTRALIAEMQRAKKLQEELRKGGHDVPFSQSMDMEREFGRRVSLGGRGTRKLRQLGSLGSAVKNWRDLSPMSEIDARREHRNLLESFGLQTPGQPSPGQPNPKKPQSFGQFLAGTSQRAGGSLIRAALPNTGAGGSIMSNAASAASATEGGAMSAAGLGRLAAGGLIGAAVYGGTKLIGAVAGKVHSTEDEGTGYADLGRRMGAGGPEFGDLRESSRMASTRMGVSYAEGGKLSASYVGRAGVDGLSGKQLRNEVSSAGGFARSLGADPSQGIDLFGELRHSKAANSSGDLQRIGMAIGDAIAKNGVFSKADDVLAAVTNFTAQATRASFTSANVEGYTGGLSSLMGLKMAGMDPSGAAAMLGKADSAIRGGGSDASRNFFLGMMQKDMPEMNAVDIGSLHDGGAFGSAQTAFGADSPAARAAAANGDTAQLKKLQGYAAKGGDKTNLDRVLGGMAGKDTLTMSANMQGYFGYSKSEADSMLSAYRENGNSIGTAVNGLSAYGVDPSKMGDTSIRGMLTSKYGTHEDRLKQSKYLQGLTGDQKLKSGESSMLDKALAEPGKNDERLKEALIKLSSTRNMEENEGDVSRRSAAALDNIASAMATKLIPLTNSIREGIMALASVLPGFEDKYGNSEKRKSAMDGAVNAVPEGKAEQRANILRDELKEVTRNPEKYTPEYAKSVKDAYEQSNSDASRVTAPGTPSNAASVAVPMSKNKADFLAQSRSGAAAAAADINADGYHIKPEWLQAQAGLETGWGSKVLPGTNNIGNIKADKSWKGKRATFKVPEYDAVSGKMSRVDQEFRAYDTPEEGWKDYSKLLKTQGRYSKVRESLTGSQFAHEMGRSGYATDPEYAAKLQSSINGIESSTFGAMPLPQGSSATAAAAKPQSVMINGTFHLRDPETDRVLANPIQQSFISAPNPAGARA